MVVVPHHTPGLRVGVVVILVLSRLSDILSPTIKWRSGVGSVQVNRGLIGTVVHKAHNGLGSSRDNEGGTRRHSIVAGKLSRHALVDFIFERLDLNFVVLDLATSFGVRGCAIESQIRPVQPLGILLTAMAASEEGSSDASRTEGVQG
jgi:hypothetical protein